MIIIIGPRIIIYMSISQGRDRINLISTNGVVRFFDVLPKQSIQLLFYVFFVWMKS